MSCRFFKGVTPGKINIEPENTPVSFFFGGVTLLFLRMLFFVAKSWPSGGFSHLDHILRGGFAANDEF